METVFDAVILAAGESVRFGRPKQLEFYKGEPLVLRAVRAAESAGASKIIVVTGCFAGRVLFALRPVRVVPAFNRHWTHGMGASIRVGIEHVEADVAVILTVDQPLITDEHIWKLANELGESGKTYAATTCKKGTGLPCAFDRKTFFELQGLTGEQGVEKIIARRATEGSFLEFADAGYDLDEPHDLDCLRAA